MQVILHSSDLDPQENRDISRNLGLKSIVGHEKQTFDELNSISSNTRQVLVSQIEQSNRLNTLVSNLLYVAKSLLELEINAYVAKKRANQANNYLSQADSEWRLMNPNVELVI